MDLQHRIERREVDLVNETYGWSFNDDGKNVYINTWLKCDGYIAVIETNGDCTFTGKT